MGPVLTGTRGQLRPCGGPGADYSLQSAQFTSPSLSFKNHPHCDGRRPRRARLTGCSAAASALRHLPSPRGLVKFVVQEAPRPRKHQG